MTEQEAADVVNALYDAHYSSLMRYALQQTHRIEAAEDIVQEAFMELYRALRSGERKANPRAWVACVVRRKSYTHFREIRRQEKVRRELEVSQPGSVAPEIETDPEGRAGDVRDLFSVLSRREEEVIFLRIAGMKYREISSELRISPNSVNTLLARALRKLQKAAQAGIDGHTVSRHANQSVPKTLQ